MTAASIFRLMLKITVSLAFLLFIFSKVDVKEIFSSFVSFHPLSIFSAVILSVAALSVAAVKWRILIPEYSFSELFRLTFAGQFYSLVLPGQVFGETAKAYRLALGSSDAPRIVASVLFDKITGILGLLIVSFGGALFSDFSRASIILVTMGIAIFVTLVFLAVLFKTRGGEKLLLFFNKTGKISKLLEFYGFLKIYFNDIPVFVRSVIFGILFQLLAVSITAILAFSLGIDVSFADMSWVFGFVSLALLIPITFGGLGLREVSFVALLALLGTAPILATALSLSVFSVQTIMALVGGLFELSALRRA
ncbi:MAG: lysylphosphatidylglycerol synthase transmembrane domain-containing protein [Patescibacteria group bacterium]